VAYDPNTPNGQELVSVIENAGYGDLALAKIMVESLGLDENTDWATVVNNSDTMTVIFGDANAREVIFNSTAAMAEVAGSPTAKNILLANSDAVNAMWSNYSSRNFAITDNTMFAAVQADITAMDALLNNTANWNAVMATSAQMNIIIASANFMSRVADNINGYTALYANTAGMTAVANSASAMTAMLSTVNSTNALLASSTAFPIVVITQTAWDVIFADSDLMNAICTTKAAMTVIGSARTRAIALASIADSPTYRALVESSAEAIAGLKDCESTNTVTMGTTGSLNVISTVPTIYSGKAWVIEVTTNFTSFPFTIYLDTFISTPTSVSTSFSTSGVRNPISRFASEIKTYASGGWSQGNSIFVYYIPIS